LTRVVALLERGGVEPLALKGPALALAAYGNVALRQFSDLDLLLRRSEAARAVEILLDAGYAPRAGYGLADLKRAGTYEITMVRAGELAEVDLHWRLMPLYFSLGLDGEDLWRRAVSVESEGAAARTLAPADHLLYLCAHGAKHGWPVLGGICDLAELIRASALISPSAPPSGPAPAIDWDELAARADRARARRALLLGALLAHELLDAPVPAAVVEAAFGQPALVRAARSFIAYVSNPGEGGPSFYQRWAVPLGVIAEPRARLRYAAARALQPSADDRRLVRLPLVLHPLYYLLRPVRVVLKESSAALRRLMRAAPSPADDSSR
jgi:hypothetical protein